MTVRTNLPWEQLMTTSTSGKYLEERAEWQPPRDLPSEPYPVEIPEFPPDERPLPESPQEEPPGPDETPPRPPPENGRRLSGAGEKPLRGCEKTVASGPRARRTARSDETYQIDRRGASTSQRRYRVV